MKVTIGEDTKYKVIKEQVNELLQHLEQTANGREEEDETLSKEIKHIESQVHVEITKLRNARREREGDLGKLIDEKSF